MVTLTLIVLFALCGGLGVFARSHHQHVTALHASVATVHTTALALDPVLASLHSKIDRLHGVPVITEVHSGQRVECPACNTSYTFARMGIVKTSVKDKAMVNCLCGAHVRVTFDESGNAICQVS